MTDQERKQRILIKLRNILFLLLGITVLFISIESIIQNPKNFIFNLIWMLLALIVVVQAIISISQSMQILNSKQRLLLFIDWIIIIAGILIANFAYAFQNNAWLIIGSAIFIAGCIPIKDQKQK